MKDLNRFKINTMKCTSILYGKTLIRIYKCEGNWKMLLKERYGQH